MGCTMKCLLGGLLVAALLVTAESLVGPVKQNYAKIRVSRSPNTFTSDCIKMDVDVEFSKYTTRRTNKTYTRQLVSVDYMTCFLKVRGTNLGQLKFADCADASAAQGFASFSLQRDSCFAMNGTPAAMFVGCSGNLETVYVNTGKEFVPEFHFANFTEDSDVAGLTVKYEDVGECADLTTYELTFLDQTVAVTRATANRIAYAFTQCVDVTFTLVRYLGGLEIGNRSVTQDFAPKDFNFINFMESSNDTGYTFSFDESCLCKDRATYTLTINDETIDVNYGQTGHHAKTFTACIPVVTFTLRRYVGGVEYGQAETTTDFAPQNFNFRDFKESSDNTGYKYYFDDDGLCTSLTNYKLSINTDTFDVTRAQNGSRSHTFTQCEENVKFTLRRYVSQRLIGDPIELTDFAPRSFSFGGSLQLSPAGTTGLTYQFTENGLCKSHATYRITIDGTTVDATAGSPVSYPISSMDCRYFNAEVVRYVGGVEDANHLSNRIFLPRDEKFLNAAVTPTVTPAVNVYFDEQGSCSAKFTYELRLVLNANTQYFTVTPSNTFTRSATLCDTVEVHIVRKLDSQDFGDKYDYTGGRVPGEHDFDFTSFNVQQRAISEWKFEWNSTTKCPINVIWLDTDAGYSENYGGTSLSGTMNCLKLYKAQTISIRISTVSGVTVSGSKSIPIKPTTINGVTIDPFATSQRCGFTINTASTYDGQQSCSGFSNARSRVQMISGPDDLATLPSFTDNEKYWIGARRYVTWNWTLSGSVFTEDTFPPLPALCVTHDLTADTYQEVDCSSTAKTLCTIIQI